MSTETQSTLPEAFGMVVRFTLKEGHGEAFDELMRRTVAEIQRHEPGTLAYVVQHVEGEPNTRIFYELYASDEAFQFHQDAAHIHEFKEQREQHLERVEVDRLSVVTHAGLVGGNDGQ